MGNSGLHEVAASPELAMRSPARRILETPQSATIRIADLVATLRREGVDVLDFSAGRAPEDSPVADW